MYENLHMIRMTKMKSDYIECYVKYTYIPNFEMQFMQYNILRKDDSLDLT